MIKQLRKVGNSSALILDRAIMEVVGLRENAEVQLTVHNGSLLVTPANPRPVDQKKFQSCLDQVVRRRRGMLKRLAK